MTLGVTFWTSLGYRCPSFTRTYDTHRYLAREGFMCLKFSAPNRYSY